MTIIFITEDSGNLSEPTYNFNILDKKNIHMKDK